MGKAAKQRRPMRYGTHNLSGFEFAGVPLRFESQTFVDVFAQKNNKTLGETLDHRRYAKLADFVLPRYRAHLGTPLGEFLYGLKYGGDDVYRRFLNKYGDLEYSIFEIDDQIIAMKMGVYAYLIGDDLVYIGRCRDSMRKRINQGYGKIHPKNCYVDGQATNCHLNARIAQERDSVSLWLCEMASQDEIVRVESWLLGKYAPPWNIQRR